MCMYMHTCVRIHICVMYTYMCIYICMHVYKYIYIYIYIYCNYICIHDEAGLFCRYPAPSRVRGPSTARRSVDAWLVEQGTAQELLNLYLYKSVHLHFYGINYVCIHIYIYIYVCVSHYPKVWALFFCKCSRLTLVTSCRLVPQIRVFAGIS